MCDLYQYESSALATQTKHDEANEDFSFDLLLKLETNNDLLLQFFVWNVNEPDKVWKAWDAYETHKTESYFLRWTWLPSLQLAIS